MSAPTTIGSGIQVGAGIGLGPSQLVLELDASNPSSYSGTGTTWYDLSRAGNNSTLIDYTPWTSNGQASYFNFTTGVAQNGAILSNQAYTKIGIFRFLGSYFGNLISGSSADTHAFWGYDTPYLQSGHNGNWATIQSPVALTANQWIFGAVSFSAVTGWRLYVNNNSVVTNPNTDPFTANPAVLEVGGFDGNGNNLGGDVGVVRVYNRVLADIEVAQLYSLYQRRFGY
jgi:Concanavalin A-like lectin/glucanases superfamily